ncbi:MAG: hypothetical protein RLZZ373_2654 [Pseudomonadota bacterium]|jgi:hypothetical protein
MTGAAELTEARESDPPGIVRFSDGLARARTVAALFCRADSVYKTLPGVDVYDAERDARTYDGPHPVVAHPPCRAWGRLRTFANPRPDERNLARLAVAIVREFGGALEHPAGSTLWDAQRLPAIGDGEDVFGGWTTGVHQWDFGHRAQKPTWLYIVGCRPSNVPELPALKLGEASHVIQTRKREDYRPQVTKPEREHTPAELAEWLVELARRCHVRANVI